MKTKLRIDYSNCPAEIVAGLREIEADRSGEMTQAKRARRVVFTQETPAGRPEFSIHHEGHTAAVRYSRPCDAFRALGILLGQIDAVPQNVTQSCQFDLMGVRIDCSRGGVLSIETIKILCRQIALMGFNSFGPYTEDTYEVPGEPFFGYMRGRYTRQDLKAIDDYAFQLGIEVIGNIRSLGHCGQILQWPVYHPLRDLPDVFLADHEPTYAFIDKMLGTISDGFRSRQIFIGTDEAHGLGTGRYRRLKGNKPPFEIFSDHLRRVCELCEKRKLRPISSADMYFRLGSKDNWYYDQNAVIPPEIVKKIPANLRLNYWDYYHTEAEFYGQWIDKHRDMGREPVVLGSVWTWNHFWAQLPFSFAATQALMAGCRSRNVRETFCTIWNDDDTQCDPLSALPGYAYYAEGAYAEEIQPEAVRLQLRGAAGVDFDDFVRASDIDLRTNPDYMRQMPDNPSVYFLWDDPFLGLMQPQIENPTLADHYRQLAQDLLKATAKPGLAKRLQFPAQIAKVLSLKIDLRKKIVAALKDKQSLQTFLHSDLTPLRREVEKLWKIHRQMWLDTYRPFGLENIEARYGTLILRLESLADRIKDHVAGKIESIPEFEVELLKIFPKDDIYSMTYYHRVATASAEK